MTLVSYAQNGEDVVLARAFSDTSTGFYIDVGASDPVVDSVTKHFYDRGWHGINIEPARIALEKLRDARPRDVNLGVGVGREEGTATFYELPQEMTGCSTLSRELADSYHREGWDLEEHEIEIKTLANVCEEHVGEREIAFLKIDVEGDELAVLAGADFDRFRPRVLVVEATRPGTPIPAYEEWEPLVLGARYEFALFDGLNRLYVREEDHTLIDTLSVPANYFDDFVPYKYAAWRDAADTARTHAGQAVTQAQQAHAREQAANAREQAANAREQQALLRIADGEAQVQSLETALEQTQTRLRSSQASARDAHTELMASRDALTRALADLRAQSDSPYRT